MFGLISKYQPSLIIAVVLTGLVSGLIWLKPNNIGVALIETPIVVTETPVAETPDTLNRDDQEKKGKDKKVDEEEYNDKETPTPTPSRTATPSPTSTPTKAAPTPRASPTPNPRLALDLEPISDALKKAASIISNPGEPFKVLSNLSPYNYDLDSLGPILTKVLYLLAAAMAIAGWALLRNKDK